MPNGHDNYVPTKAETISLAKKYEQEDRELDELRAKYPHEATQWDKDRQIRVRSKLYPIEYAFPAGQGIGVDFVLNGRTIGRMGGIDRRNSNKDALPYSMNVSWIGIITKFLDEINSDETEFLRLGRWVANGEFSDEGKVPLDVLNKEFEK